MTDAMGADDHRLGESDRVEPEIARVGRVLLACRLEERAAAIHRTARELMQAAFDGEDITRDDIEALRRAMEDLEYTLRDWADPVAADVAQRGPVVDLASVHGERDDAQ